MPKNSARSFLFVDTPGSVANQHSFPKESEASRLHEKPPAILPLPQGEGRGEGETDVRQPPSSKPAQDEQPFKDNPGVRGNGAPNTIDTLHVEAPSTLASKWPRASRNAFVLAGCAAL